ncbi:hypothetical protein LCGC14_3107890, partial [marine sediment metagenome]
MFFPERSMLPQASNATGYTRLTPRQAQAVLATLILISGLFVGVTFSPLASSNLGNKKRSAEGDIALYRAKVDRIHAGEGYYQAAGTEMRTRGYPTGSVFNWRFPAPFWLIGCMPDVEFGKAMLSGLALVLMLSAFEALARETQNRIRRPIACALLLTGPLMPCVLGDLFVLPVLW